MHYEIQRIELWPVVKIAFFVCAVLGLFPGIVVSLFLWGFSNLLRAVMPGEMGDLSGFPPAMLMMGAILAPIYGAIGAVFAGIAAALYNLLARWIGGVELSLMPAQEESIRVVEGAQDMTPDSMEERNGSPQ
jgi:hypothetical protein